MAQDLGEVVEEGGGKESFREILRILIQENRERQNDGSNAVAPAAKRRPVARILAERVLLVSGLALLVVYGGGRLEGFLGSRAALKRFAAPAPSSTSGGHPVAEDIGGSGVDLRLWDAERFHADQETLKQPSGAPLAVLHISKIGLEVPVLDGTDARTLNHAVGRISGTARPGEPGNMAIAGHRDGFFRGLKRIGIGDTVELKTPEGTSTYVVDETKIVDPDNVDVLGPRLVPSLTLVTCYPFYFIGGAPQRYVVFASRTDFAPQKYNPTEQGSLFLANEK